MKTLKVKLKTLAFAAVVCCSTANTTFGQWGYGQDPMQEIDNILASFGDPMAEIDRIQAEADAAAVQSARNVVENYRRSTGDYQTPDQIVFQSEMSNYYAQNPGVWQAEMQQRNINFQKTQNAYLDAQNTINRVNSDIYNSRMASNERGTRQFINGAIRGEWDYRNPNTGNIHRMSYIPQGNVYQGSDGALMIQNGNGGYRSYNGGYGVEMEEWNH